MGIISPLTVEPSKESLSLAWLLIVRDIFIEVFDISLGLSRLYLTNFSNSCIITRKEEKKMSKYELGWLAGIIDGEGCLYARFTKRKSLEVRLDIQAVSKTMIDAIEVLYSKFGFAYTRQPPKMFKLSKRPAERIIVRRKESLLRLLNKISPFLIVKKQESIRVIAYLQKATKVAKYHLDSKDLTLVNDLRMFKSIV